MNVSEGDGEKDGNVDATTIAGEEEPLVSDSADTVDEITLRGAFAPSDSLANGELLEGAGGAADDAGTTATLWTGVSDDADSVE